MNTTLTNSTHLMNYTPHAVTIGNVTIVPCGTVARVESKIESIGDMGGIPIVKETYGEPLDLPEEVSGTIYIVSGLVRASVPHRKDLASPSGLLRDEQGRVTGCVSLAVN